MDVIVKVKEKGRNSIGFSGGVSGLAGKFFGFNYATNNFLGLGETLSMQFQWGTFQRLYQFRLHGTLLVRPSYHNRFYGFQE